jgi:alpha-L-rhamnosidase
MNLWRSIFLTLALLAPHCLGGLVNGAAVKPPIPGASLHQRSAIRVTDLRCEYTRHPLGVESPRPHLSWVLTSRQRDQRQTAFQILVSSSAALLARGQGDLWDSGPVSDADSIHVAYGGAPLASRQRVFWKVRVWDAAGNVSSWSSPAFWEMGLLRPEDWVAQWIGSGPATEPRPPTGFFKSTNELDLVNEPVAVDGRATLLRQRFAASQPIRRARAYVTGLGYYELSINGRRVGDRVLAPAKSNYRKWVLYDTYDVTRHVQQGTNVLGLLLGNGWFNPYPKWWEPYRMQWFGSKRALCQLHVEYTDGSSEIIASDGSWETAPGPVLSSCVFDGEVYDATQERPGWDQPAGLAPSVDNRWQPANVVEAPGGVLISHLMPPIRVVEHLKPVAMTQPRPGLYVFDFGQNFAGWARLKAKGPRGARITLRYAEDLSPDGMIDVTSNERALATDVYIMNGEGTENYEPKFTFHGFRYVEVTGFPGTPSPASLWGCVVHTDAAATGTFVCDNPLINRIHRATHWAQRSNLMGYPMDCPQRDERLGWLGDAMVTMEEAMFNFDLPVFYRHWLDGIRFNQSEVNGDISIVSPRPYMPEEPDPTWSSAFLVMNWHYYLHYADRRFLAEQFPAMQRYVDYLGTQATNHILPQYWIGDWGTIVEGWKEGEPVSVSTAFYYYDATILAQAAEVLGRTADAERYRTLAAAIRTAFDRRFFEVATKRYDQGTLFAQAFPLFLGIPRPEDAPAVIDLILRELERRQGRFDVGVLGARYLIDALTAHGRSETAYQLVNQTGFPSWARMLENGRTTLSEFWDLRGSHNHVMMGSIDAWFYRTLAGIQPDPAEPGFAHVIIKPFFPPSLGMVRASVRTVRGPVTVNWSRRHGRLDLDVSLPPNTRATVRLPVSSSQSIDSTPARSPDRKEEGAATYAVGSGHYRFRILDPP